MPTDSSGHHGKKREREADVNDGASANSPTGNTTTNFRNVSACNRCRNRKNRCDQKLPKCSNCERAQVSCVGFDPISKREIPRSYVYYLETRVVNLEALLVANGIDLPPAQDDFPISEKIKPGINVPFPIIGDKDDAGSPTQKASTAPQIDPRLTIRPEEDEHVKLDKLMDNIGMASVQGTPDARHVAATTSGISFAKVVFAAVKRSKDHQSSSSSSSRRPSNKDGITGAALSPTQTLTADTATGGGAPPRDSFFGLHTRPTVAPAPFPDKALGIRLVNLYFEHANPQIPILHRGEFTNMFERVYAAEPRKRTARELYFVNIVFAIGSGIFMGGASDEEQEVTVSKSTNDDADGSTPGKKRAKVTQKQQQLQYEPEEYHAAAISHLEHFLSSPIAALGVGNGLEELQAVCLLAGLALLRPVAPGLWYIIGVAVRLSIDLGLHTEEVDQKLDNNALHPTTIASTTTRSSTSSGRKQWIREMRRRLWWCVFNLDRLVSSCVGRPVAITESIVTTEFPSLLDDRFITPTGFLRAPNTLPTSPMTPVPTSDAGPSYKLISHHYLRLRLLQSEILQVFQHCQADNARQLGATANNPYLIPDLTSPFLQRFQGSFRAWRQDVDLRLWEWKESAPRAAETGVAFAPLFLDLNYWQAVVMLYRQSLAVPEPLAGEMGASGVGNGGGVSGEGEGGKEVKSPGAIDAERAEDQQMVFMKVAQAGQIVLKIYRQLHRQRRVNYTFLATHHLFMSGISFLYAIWHSTLVRSQLSIDDVDFTVLAATSVLSDLMEKCPPAEACRDAFVRMSNATISMVMSTTGFGHASTLEAQQLTSPTTMFGDGRVQNPVDQMTSSGTLPGFFDSRSGGRTATSRPVPQFDMNLRDLFSDEEIAQRPMAAQNRNARLPEFRRLSIRPAQNDDASGPAPDAVFALNSADNMSGEMGNVGGYDVSMADPSLLADNSYSGPGQQGDVAFDGLDFLDMYSFGDAARSFWNGEDLASVTSYGSVPTGGGMAAGRLADGSGAYDASGELFENFFFGNTGS